MKKLGIVEGFYGSLMSFSQRNAIVESLVIIILNFYLYAPKEDPFIRKHIDLDHSKEWEEQFQNFCHNANEKIFKSVLVCVQKQMIMFHLQIR